MYRVRRSFLQLSLFAFCIAFPQESSADNSHYIQVTTNPQYSDNLHASFSLRSQDQINQYTNGQGKLDDQPGGNNPRIQFDPVMDAARVSIPENRASIGVPWQLRIPFEAIDKTTGHNEVSIQWEVRFANSYLDVARHGVQTQKAFSIYKAGKKRNNIRIRLSATDETAVALPTATTSYNIELEPGGGTGPLKMFVEMPVGGIDGKKNFWDWQPGGDTVARNNHTYSASDHLRGLPDVNAFVLRPNLWIRYTVSMTFVDGKQRFRMWLSDEQTPPTLVIAKPDDPTKGFLTDYIPELSGTDQFAFEWGSSQTGTTNGPMEAWMRNVVVFKNATVPFGVFGPPDTVKPNAPTNLRRNN